MFLEIWERSPIRPTSSTRHSNCFGAQVLLESVSVGFLDRNGPQQLKLHTAAAAAAAAAAPNALREPSMHVAGDGPRQHPLAGKVLEIVVHAMGRNSAAVAFDLKGLVSQNVTLAGEQLSDPDLLTWWAFVRCK